LNMKKCLKNVNLVKLIRNFKGLECVVAKAQHKSTMLPF